MSRPGAVQSKTGHAEEQARPDVLNHRLAWFERQPNLDPERLVFIDETWASSKMARTYGLCARGQRLRMSLPHRHWKITTFIASVMLTGMVAPFVSDGPINREVFEVFVGRVLVPELQAGDIVVLDNLGSHNGPTVRAMIEAAAARL
jgi:hypothetical protein